MCKRVLVLFCMIVLLATGCQNKESIPNGFYDYNKEKVESAVGNLSFNPEIPQFVPMEVDFLVSDQYQVEDTLTEALDISFYTRNNDLLSIQFFCGDIEEIAIYPEEVKIGEDLNGKYIHNTYAKILYWKKNGVTYKMTYRSGSTSEDMESVTKQQLIEVANSFHS